MEREFVQTQHGCRSNGCQRRVGVDFVFCKHHWERLPSMFKEPLIHDPPGSSSYYLSVDEAVLYFDKVEGRI